MKAVAIISLLMIAGISLPAQITSVLNRSPTSTDEVSIRNNFAKSVVAFAVTVKQIPRTPSSSHAPFVVYSDPLVEPAAAPLLPGQERTVIRMGVAPGIDLHGSHLLEEPVTTAGIFADGTTTGDPGLLTALISRRSNTLLAVETSLEVLSDAGRRNIPRSQMIDQFERMAESVLHWYLPPEQQVGIRVYQPIIAKLMDTPEGPLGTPFPPSTLVEEETAMLRRERVALLESQPSMADMFFVTPP